MSGPDDLGVRVVEAWPVPEFGKKMEERLLNLIKMCEEIESIPPPEWAIMDVMRAWGLKPPPAKRESVTLL